MIILPAIFTLFVIYLLTNVKKIKKWFLERKRRIELGEKIPGPKGNPIFGNVFSLFGTPKEMKENFDKENGIGFKNNDPLRRYWIGNYLLVHILRADAAKIIFDNNVEISKGSMYNFFKNWLGDGLITSVGEKWKERRRLLTPTFHFNMLKKYFEVFNTESRTMIKNVENFTKTGEEIDIHSYSKKMALDIICETAMGIKLNAQNNPSSLYLKTHKKFFELFSKHSINILYRIPIYYYFFGEGFERDRVVNTLREFTQSVIKEKTIEFEKNDGVPKDDTFLSNLLMLKKDNKWTDEDLREEVDTFLFAGHDTSANLITFLWWSLACHQDVQEKVYQEIYSVYGDEEKDVASDDLPKLSFLDMVIKETLRMYPIVPMYGRSLQNELEICGYTLPKGTDVLICPLYTNFNPSVFPNPHKFDPYRFLPEITATRDVFDFTPFSAGPRNCIGQKFALTEVKIVTIWLLRKYKLTTNRDESFVEHSNISLQNLNEGIPIIFQKR